MEEVKKREAVYNPDADKKWNDNNKEHRRYLTDRTSARRFIRTKATLADLEELQKMMEERKATLNM
ncbi:MAG: hypothetical protein UEJ45_06475 [Peptococcaceae bacterium]|nr:hypothetical protein [Peptococcaceae bacterium]